MKNLREVRGALSGIEDVWLDTPPETGYQGDESAVSTLWDGDELGRSTYLDRNADEDIDDQPRDLDEIFEYGADVDLEELESALGGARGASIRQSVMVKGVDALAYYVPFHVRGAQWGIYIPLSSVAYMMVFVFRRASDNPDKLMRMAIRAMHQHELFHFAVEYAMAQLEQIAREPLYARISEFNNEVGYRELEEQLANANMIRSFRGRRIQGKTAALRNFYHNQPAGYRDADRSIRNAIFRKHCDSLIINYYSGLLSPLQNEAFDGAHLLPPFPIDWRYCPVHLIHDVQRFEIDPSLIDFFTKVELIEEDKRFKKDLKKLGVDVQRMWASTKRKLASSCITSGLDFKQWKEPGNDNVYSVRVNRAIRAHIEYIRDQKKWIARGIGDHKSMGHG